MGLQPIYTTKGAGEDWQAAASHLGYRPMTQPLNHGNPTVVRHDRFENERVEIEHQH